jgi:hypothetical protein
VEIPGRRNNARAAGFWGGTPASIKAPVGIFFLDTTGRRRDAAREVPGSAGLFESKAHGSSVSNKWGSSLTMTSPRKPTLVELDGEVTELQALESVASACDCTIEPGPGQKFGWLGGAILDAVTTPQQARDGASKVLILLNGLVRLQNPQHRNVDLANEVYQNGLLYRVSPQWRPRAGSRLEITAPPQTGPRTTAPVDPRCKRLVTDPKLADIVEVFSEEMSWQRLRVAFEKITALVGKGDNALVRHGYAKQAELTRFKANVEDPRLSGADAVHGVPRGQLKGRKMTEREGFDFVVRLLNTYLDKHPR